MADLNQRVHILNMILSNFQCITQWLPSHIENANEYMRKAEGLIEHLEVLDCGSIGGYDKESKCENVSSFKLLDRFLALVKKYDSAEDLEFTCGWTMGTMVSYYKTISELREKSIANGRFDIEYWDETKPAWVKAKGVLMKYDTIEIVSGEDEGSIIHITNNRLDEKNFKEVKG